MTLHDPTVDAANGRAMTAPVSAPARQGLVTPFDALYAPKIASWVQSDEELTWLAPGTRPPLTAHKVMNWGNDRGRRLLFWGGRQDEPIGYSELNNMPGSPRQMWIGHFVLAPAHRGRAYGSQFARALLALAFRECSATDVLLVVFPENVAAIRCYERAGMVVTGRERKYFQATGNEHTFLRMGITRTRYRRLVAVRQLPAEPRS
ncbi:MAG: GNAT family N-acetyltransferase [Phycisphaerae bacterium]|nr:GNAT family N-acetyltransferase [Phycisphaerae bacterium]